MAYAEDDRLASLLIRYSKSSLPIEESAHHAGIPELYSRLEQGKSGELYIEDNLGIRLIQRLMGNIAGKQLSERDVMALSLNRTWAFVGDQQNAQRDFLFLGRALGEEFGGLDNAMATISITRSMNTGETSRLNRIEIGTIAKDSAGIDRVVAMNFRSSGLGGSYLVSVSDAEMPKPLGDPELHAYQIASKPLPSTPDIPGLGGGIITAAMTAAVLRDEQHSRGIFLFNTDDKTSLAIAQPYRNFGRSYAEDQGISYVEGTQRVGISFDVHNRKGLQAWRIDLPRALAEKS